ncbi:MAG: PIN domain-containing protein [Salinivirgaceae bacterium]
MKNIVIDTCVFIHIVRGTDTGRKCIEALEKYDEAANVIVSVATKAELESFIAQSNWGKAKIERLNKILEEITYIDISNADQILIREQRVLSSQPVYSSRRQPKQTPRYNPVCKRLAFGGNRIEKCRGRKRQPEIGI